MRIKLLLIGQDAKTLEVDRSSDDFAAERKERSVVYVNKRPIYFANPEKDKKYTHVAVLADDGRCRIGALDAPVFGKLKCMRLKVQLCFPAGALTFEIFDR